MTTGALPSFASRDWLTATAGGGIVVEIGSGLDSVIDRGRLEDRGVRLVQELSGMAGLRQPPPCTVRAGDAADRVLLRVDDRTRAVLTGQPSLEARHQTGWALDLPRWEALTVAALERMLLSDPGLLLEAGGVCTWPAADHLLAEHLRDPELPAIMLSHGLRLTDPHRVLRALALADPVHPADRLTDLQSSLSEPVLEVQVAAHAAAEQIEAFTARVEQAARSGWLGLGVVEWPIRVSIAEPGDGLPPGPAAETAESSPVRARVLLGGLPLTVLEPGAETIQLVADLRRVAWRSIDLVSLRLRLDRLALYAPKTVAAVRARLDTRILARVLSRASREFVVRDLPRVLDDMLSVGTTEEESLLAALRPGVVERHLGYLLDYQPLLGQITVTPDCEAALAAQASAPAVPEDLGRPLLEELAAMIPATPWQELMTAVVVDDRAAAAPLRRLLSAQVPDLLVLSRGEVPDWAAGPALGRLGAA